jgi:hypothetical protein
MWRLLVMDIDVGTCPMSPFDFATWPTGQRCGLSGMVAPFCEPKSWGGGLSRNAQLFHYSALTI